MVLREFLDPRNWRPPENREFALDAGQISELCDQAESIFKEEPSVLKLQGELLHLISSDTAQSGFHLLFLEGASVQKKPCQSEPLFRRVAPSSEGGFELHTQHGSGILSRKYT